MRPDAALLALWVAWALSWLAAAAWSNRTEKRPQIRVEAAYRLPIVIGTVLFILQNRRHIGAIPLWPKTRVAGWTCVALLVLGFAFTWWARIHLGKFWSSHITRKAGHRLIDSGPYAIVRHPIYTGLLLALAASAASQGTLLALAGFLLVALGLWMKARTEEHWLSQELESGTYAAYRARVPMLIPRLRSRNSR